MAGRASEDVPQGVLIQRSRALPVLQRGQAPLRRLEVLSRINDEVVSGPAPQIETTVRADDPETPGLDRRGALTVVEKVEHRQVARRQADSAHRLLVQLSDAAVGCNGPASRQPGSDLRVEVVDPPRPIIDTALNLGTGERVA